MVVIEVSSYIHQILIVSKCNYFLMSLSLFERVIFFSVAKQFPQNSLFQPCNCPRVFHSVQIILSNSQRSSKTFCKAPRKICGSSLCWPFCLWTQHHFNRDGTLGYPNVQSSTPQRCYLSNNFVVGCRTSFFGPTFYFLTLRVTISISLLISFEITLILV